MEPFVAVLGASSFTYVEAIRTQQLPGWVNVHIRMVEYFGGHCAVGPRPAQERDHPSLPLRARRQPHLRGPRQPLLPSSDAEAWRSDRKLRMLASRPQFLADGVLKSIAVPHFVSNQGADCIGLYRTTSATTSPPVFGGAQDNDVFGNGRVRRPPTADGSRWTVSAAPLSRRSACRGFSDSALQSPATWQVFVVQLVDGLPLPHVHLVRLDLVSVGDLLHRLAPQRLVLPLLEVRREPAPPSRRHPSACRRLWNKPQLTGCPKSGTTSESPSTFPTTPGSPSGC